MGNKGDKSKDALHYYCEDCGDDIHLTIERDSDADVGGFILSGLHMHMAGAQVELPPVKMFFDDMAEFLEFAEVMRGVREDVSENE